MKVSSLSNIGLICICTGKYIMFLERYLETFIKYFCPENKKTFFILTDSNIEGLVIKYQTKNIKIVPNNQNKLGWPYDSLFRFKMINSLAETNAFEGIDVLFFTNANLICVDNISHVDVLIDQGLICTHHPCFYEKENKIHTFENNPRSTAFVPLDSRYHYYQAALFGGTREEFLIMSKVIDQRIQEDERNGLMAVWHDESHLNRYLLMDVKPTKILMPRYLKPENQRDVEPPIKIVQLDKNGYGGHSFLRQ